MGRLKDLVAKRPVQANLLKGKSLKTASGNNNGSWRKKQQNSDLKQKRPSYQ